MGVCAGVGVEGRKGRARVRAGTGQAGGSQAGRVPVGRVGRVGGYLPVVSCSRLAPVPEYGQEHDESSRPRYLPCIAILT